ncbi:hypothetical protein DAD99_18710 [Pseudarthrobacter sp. AB1]|nr:hypothetical protein [Pseudarthrobacter sp. AB1]
MKPRQPSGPRQGSIPPAGGTLAGIGAASGSPVDDPQLRRMLATHMHCGEPMRLVPADKMPVLLFPEASVSHPPEPSGGVLMYRCACGFTFDRSPD